MMMVMVIVMVVVVVVTVLENMTSYDQLYHLIVNHTLLCIGILDRWVVISHKVALNELDGNGRLPDPAATHHHDLVLVLVHPLLLEHLLGPSSWPPPSSPPRSPPRSPP